MFGLDPLSRPVAVVEMLLLLALAALIGWLLGRWARDSRIRTLRSALASRPAERNASRPTRSPAPTPAITLNPASEPLPSAPVAAPPPVATETKPLRPAEAVPPPVVQPLRAPGDEPAVPPVSRPPATAVPVIEVPPVEAPIPEAPAFDKPVPVTSVPSTEVAAAGTPVLQPQPANRPQPQSFLPGNTEAAVLNRIAARAGELNFDRIGRATAAQADDLKDIDGIGPFLERKLHSLGIYTYRQIANFTKQDGEQVNDLIEFFPGRVERDNWVGQAKQLHERKYGARAGTGNA